jgi:hypothetical protein
VMILVRCGAKDVQTAADKICQKFMAGRFKIKFW